MSGEHTQSAQVALVRQLGKGGTATVHEAIVAGRRVALKRPRAEVLERRPEALSLFEREYHTLAQLAHPNIVEVYSYAINGEGPYYTMELLEDGGLSELLPMAWRAACRVLRDVAAALAMVHSRRLVHRDVSLHNVRLTADGRAKLMDFGAMTPIGIPTHTIGTPAYMAPEAVYRQALDQRTDLYSLGALGYRLLCGRDAYAARRIDQLRDAWRSRPRPLSERISDIPPQLDELIRQLLSLNPDGRFRTAAEVFVRLSAVAGLEDADDKEIARAYLATPALVGRDRELAAIRRHILQTSRARGSAVIVEGPAGAGRSRLLDACIVDGQLMGAQVLRARASTGSAARFGVLATLGAQLLEMRPACSPGSARIQALLGRTIGSAPTSPDEEATLQQELIAWFLRAADKALLLIVDDLHLADLQSSAVLVRLVEAASRHPVTLIVSALSGGTGSSAQALRLLRERATVLSLSPLNEEQTLTLVRSLFDDVVNVQLAAKRIYDIAQGNPQATVDLAEWLVDGSHVVHEGGRWLIPDTLSGLPLPASIEDALRQRVSQLSTDARKLGAAIAIAGDAELSLGDYSALLERPEEQHAHAALAELLGAHVLTTNVHGYGLSQVAYRDLLVELMDHKMLASVHQRIAQVCLSRNQPDWAIYHLFFGATPELAIDLLLARLKAGASPSKILHSLEERAEFLRAMLELCNRVGRPAADVFMLKNELVKRAEVKASLVRAEIAELCQLYKELTGYNDWLALPADMAALPRILAAVKAASARHHGLPKSEQILDPREALPSLLDFVGSCLAAATANSELALVEQMPPLAPFAPLSESIALFATYTEAVEATIGGRAEVASAKFIGILHQLDDEAGAKLGEAADRLRRHAMIAIGMLNAGLSRSIALDYADRLEALASATRDPYAKSTSLRVRHQYHMRRGNFRQAQHWQHEVEIDKLTDRSAVFNPSGIYALSWIYATLGSDAGMRDCLTQMREYSSVSEGLRIWEGYMAAEYDRLRGAGDQALPRFYAILEGNAGRHMAWLYASHGVLLCLEALGRLDEGKRLGEELLARAEAAQLSAARGLILRPLALIEARLGNFPEAIAHLSENIEQCRKHGMGGINLGIAYEFRARVAIWANDREGFQTFVALCAEQYHAGGGSPDLTARFDALLSDARRAGVIETSWQSPDLGPMTLSHAQVELRDRLADCSSSETRCLQALLAIAQSSNAAGGHLYGLTSAGLKLLASLNGEPSPTLAESASSYLSAIVERQDGTESLTGSSRTESTPSATFTESEATASVSAHNGERRRGETCEGFFPELVCKAGDNAALGLFLLHPGALPIRAPDNDLIAVVVDALANAGDLRALG